MNAKRIIGIVLLIIGIIMICFSVYIKQEVSEGKIKIARGEKAVGRGKDLFNLTPVTEPFSGMFTGAAEKKIEKGKKDVEYYENLSNGLMAGGVVLIVVGVILVAVGRKKKK